MNIFDPESVKHIFLYWLGLLTTVIFFLFGTTPDRIGPLGVSIFFIILYLLIVLSLQLVVLLLRKIIARPKHLGNWSFAYSFVAGFGPVLLISLQSLHQLALRDGVIFIGLAVAVIFYLSRIAKN